MAILIMGQSVADVAFYAYIIPFLISAVAGAILAGIVVFGLKKAHALHTMQQFLND